MNPSARLTDHIVARIQELEPIVEQVSAEQPYQLLRQPDSNKVIGSIRLFNGTELIDKVVVVQVTAAAMQMDAYMVMAFTRPGSLYPHLAFDSEWLPDDAAFHIDLLHKQDFSTDIAYVQSVMEPLTPAFEVANNNPDFRFSDATRLMKALLNPWMASYHCAPEHLADARPVIDAYLDHWLSLRDCPVDEVALNIGDDEMVAAYDKAHRAALFDPKVDVLWEFLVNIIGLESRDLILQLVRGER